MPASFADESALLTELRELLGRGHFHAVAERVAALPAEEVERRTPFALAAAEANGRLGAHAAADQAATAAARAARAGGDAYAEGRALNMRGLIALERGDAAAAERWFGAALAIVRSAPDAGLAARCLNNLGILASLRGDHAAALADYQLALAAYQQQGGVRGLAESHHNIAITRRDLGDLPGALAAADDAVRLADESGDESLAAVALVGRAEGYLLAGDAALAAAHLTQARATFERLDDPVGLAETLRLEAAVARRRGDLDTALAALERAAALAAAQGSAHVLADIERDLGDLRRDRGDDPGAREAWRSAVARFQRLGASHQAALLADRLAAP